MRTKKKLQKQKEQEPNHSTVDGPVHAMPLIYNYFAMPADIPKYYRICFSEYLNGTNRMLLIFSLREFLYC